MNNTINNNNLKSLNKKHTLFILENLFSKLKNHDFLKKYVKKENAFIRDRKLNLITVSSHLFARGLTSLNNFLNQEIYKRKHTVSKQAFSKARVNISPNLFADLNNQLLEDKYLLKDCINLYKKKYLLLDVDGSSAEIPNTKNLRDKYGHTKSQDGSKQNARCSFSNIYDPLNSLIIGIDIDKFGTSERTMAFKMIDQIRCSKVFKEYNKLYLFDRGYFSKEMLIRFLFEESNYLFRIKSNNLKNVRKQMTGKDEVIKVKLKEINGTIKNETIKNLSKEFKDLEINLRISYIKLSSGEEEILLSNIPIEDVNYKEMKDLYFKRWRIEENYKYLKSKMELENFSGRSVISVKQDFYACMLQANINYLINCVANEEIKNKESNKYGYKINNNTLVGKTKELFNLVVIINVKKIMSWIWKIIKNIRSSKVVVRDGTLSNKRNIDTRTRANRYNTNFRAT